MKTFKNKGMLLRDPKIYAQTKLLYCYLEYRADYKTGLTYPPQEQILKELNLSDKMYKEGIQVLIKKGYIKPTTKEQTDKDGKKYNINCFEIIDDSDEPNNITDTKKD